MAVIRESPLLQAEILRERPLAWSISGTGWAGAPHGGCWQSSPASLACAASVRLAAPAQETRPLLTPPPAGRHFPRASTSQG
eukprot:scaffold21301_cov67-Isochrysis_galbana.AAC.1